VSAVHFVVPAGIDDPARPSGGNGYDRRLARGLDAAGWTVHLHEVPGSWPWPDGRSLGALAAVVGGISDGAVVLLDGLVASPAPEVLSSEMGRLRLVVLVHMPLGQGTTDDGAREREGTVLSAAASVVTTSAWARRALLELYSLPGDRVHVAEPGADVAEVAPGTKTSGALLSVAAVIPGKGQDLLLDALALLAGLPWRCTCVGSLDRDPAFADRVRGRAPRVRFTGPRTGAALDRAYAATDLLVLPSRAETYGMVVTEALARGVPVLASDVGGVSEALGDGGAGRLVPPGDAAALGAALRRWLSDAELRARLRRAARQRRASLRGWDATAAAVARVLTEVAAVVAR
jgi:glycosyltransferase involved in cell wall biosynthesis